MIHFHSAREALLLISFVLCTGQSYSIPCLHVLHLELSRPSKIILLIVLVNILRQSLLQILDANLAVLAVLLVLVRGDGDASRDVDDTVLGNAVSNNNGDVAIELDASEAAPHSNINGNVLAAQQGREVHVVVLHDVCLLVSRAVKGVAVQGGVRDNLVLQQSLEELQAGRAVEQEGIGLGSETGKGIVGGGEDGGASRLDAVDVLDEVGLLVGQEEGRELAGQEGELPADQRGRKEDAVDAVDDSVVRTLWKK